MRAELRRGAALSMGVDHPAYDASLESAPEIRASLAGDLA